MFTGIAWIGASWTRLKDWNPIACRGLPGSRSEPSKTDGEDSVQPPQEEATEPPLRVFVPENPCVAYNDQGGGRVVFCHLAVEAISDRPLKRCHARLVRVMRSQADGWVREEAFAAAMRLKWAFAGTDHPEHEYRDIVSGDDPQLLDIVYTSEKNPGRAYFVRLDAQPIGLPEYLAPGPSANGEGLCRWL
jgi:hypothetical protein